MHNLRFLLLVIVSFAHVSEIDSFSTRDPSLRDATDELNTLMRGYLLASIKEANRWGYCDPEAFRKDLHNRIGGIFWTTIEDDINQSTTIDKRKVSRSHSVYQDVSFFHAPALFIADFGPILRIGDSFIGSDKLGHFITTGYLYYQKMRKGGIKLDVLAIGEKEERSYFGLETTGIYSKADIAANWQGFDEFWRVLIEPDEDAFVGCKDGVYTLLRYFDWSKHANPAWDEGINCNEYKNEEMTKAIDNRIKLLEKQYNTNLSCPIETNKCQDIIKRFGDVAPLVISEKCFGV